MARNGYRRACLLAGLFYTLLMAVTTVVSHECNDTAPVNIQGAASTDEGRLVQGLMDAYGLGFVRPVLDQTRATKVEYRLLIHELLDLNIRDQTIYINAHLKVTWTDEFLQWDPSEYGGTTEIFLPVSNIWQPDITLVRNIDTSFEITKETSAKIEPDGKVSWLTPIFLTSSCPVTVKYFPFDTQRCQLKFSSWSYSVDKIDLHVAMGPDAEQNRYSENGVWDLLEVETSRELAEYESSGIFSEISYELVLKRRSEYYVTNVVLPFVFLSLLANIIFLLPPDGKDSKANLAVVTLLAMVVFLQLVSGVMPPTGETPILATYFLVLIIFVCISVAMVIIVFAVQFHTGSPPRWFRRSVLGFMAKAVCMYNEEAAGVVGASDDQDSEMKVVPNNNAAETSPGPAKRASVELPESLLNDVGYLRKKAEMQGIDDHVAFQWQYASRVIDRWLLLINLTIWAILTIVLLVVSSGDHDPEASN